MGRLLEIAKAAPPEPVVQPARVAAGAPGSPNPIPASAQKAWPTASLRAEQRFGQPHAKLFPFIGRKVRTPTGPGILLQVFAGRVTVLLDSELSRCSFFRPLDIEPVSWEVSE